MIIAANILFEKRYKLFKEAFTCATHLDCIVITELYGIKKTCIEYWRNMLPRWATALRNWGEAGVVKTKTKTTPQIAYRSITCMFVGYSVNHTDLLYRIWNPKSNCIRVSIYVNWIKYMYY